MFICGDGRRMAPAVRESFITIYSVHAGDGDDEAHTWPASLTESGHHIEDVWPADNRPPARVEDEADEGSGAGRHQVCGAPPRTFRH